MRVLIFANGPVGASLTAWLRESGADIVGAVLHPAARRSAGDALLEALDLPKYRIFDGSTLQSPETLAAITALAPDLGVSLYFGYILRRPLLDLFPRGVVNLHPSLLPHGRGAYPNVWAIVDGTPAGVTLHWVDEGVDTGDIAAQREVPVDPWDTGESLYRKLSAAAQALFRDAWPALVADTLPRTPQPPGPHRAHRVKDVAAIDAIDLDAPTTARALLDVLRARTFPPYAGAYFRTDDGRRVEVRVRFEVETRDAPE